METRFGRAARLLKFEGPEMQVVVGSLLGDGTLLETTSGFCFRVHHGLKQKYLADWKYGILRRFVRTLPRASGSGYYFRTVTHPVITALRLEFYEGNRKVVPFHCLERHLGGLALATWIMDDGAADGAQLRINTQGFTFEENQRLISLLKRKFGLSMTVNFDKGRPRLRCRASSMEKLVQIVGPYIHPEMCYKLASHLTTRACGTAPFAGN